VGVIRLPVSGRALGLVLGARPHILRIDAQIGGYDSVAYPALELSAKGILPLAMTDCLNFGNPENSEVMSQFVASLQSMSEQAEVFAAPIISGNVSFYNETLGQNITSTPATGLVGLRDELEKIPRSHFTATEDEVYLLRRKFITTNGMAGEMRREKLQFSGDYSAKAVGEFASLTRHLSLLSGVMATRVVGKFGLGYALARMTTPELGFAADNGALELNDLTHENLYEVIMVVRPDQALALRELFQSLNKDKATEFKRIGHTRAQVFKLTPDVSLQLKDIHAAYNTSWEVQLAGLS
jgi:phosphoribosylformylglycinamidine synthase